MTHQRPKVLHIIQQLELLGGAERQLVYLINALSERYAFHVVFYHEDELSHAGALQELGIPVELIARAPGLRGKWQFMHDLTQQVRNLEPDILQLWLISAHVWGSLAYWLSGRRCPLVAAIRNAVPNHRLMALAYRALMTYTDVVTCNTQRTRQDLLAHGVCAEDVVYIPNGIDAGGYSALACPALACPERLKRQWHIPLDKTVIGTVGRIVAQKNPMLFVEMARLLAPTHPEAHFVMVGDGVLRQSVEDAIARYGLQHAFTLVGTQHDISAWLGVFDVFVLTSAWEGLPNAVMEAMCARLPVVATSVGGVPELLDHGHSGWLVEPDDVQGLLDLIT
ncbi:glycosyltransferase [Candidatus Entotheonella palauensis]|uniref:glycosyltransferase n=1 Tax=Candidatus Entotheonella palauensis TaxID=93172 RepID=UPI0015C445BA|nr:glycosyltransferase [Candidatus Entotheonella palauensis]